MELPDDVLCLIREFSRPRMQFIPEYKKVMLDLGIADWLEVRQRLCDKDAEQVITALLAWADAFLITEKIQTRTCVTPDHPEFITMVRILSAHIIHRDSLNRHLQVLLVGEETVRKHERWLRYEDIYSDDDY